MKLFLKVLTGFTALLGGPQGTWLPEFPSPVVAKNTTPSVALSLARGPELSHPPGARTGTVLAYATRPVFLPQNSQRVQLFFYEGLPVAPGQLLAKAWGRVGSKQQFISAPMGGIIHQIQYRRGAPLKAGTTLATLLDPKHLRVRLSRPLAADIQAGDSVQLWLAGNLAPTVSAKVERREVGPATSQTFSLHLRRPLPVVPINSAIVLAKFAAARNYSD